MADLRERPVSVRVAVARELACSLELRVANALLAAAAIAQIAAPAEPVATAARVWAPLGLVAVLLPALAYYQSRHRVVLVMAGHARAYAALEALWMYRGLRGTYEDGLRVSDLWVGRVLLGWAATALGIAVALLTGALLSGGRFVSPQVAPGPALLAAALSGWVSVAMWRRYLRHQVARVTHVDSFRLMTQAGYRWTWWWGWR